MCRTSPLYPQLIIGPQLPSELYGEFEAMMRENIDWRKEPLGVALKKDNAIVQYPSSIPGEHVYLANTVVDKWCLLNAAFYLYLNMAEGGHGNYATGQSYGVYPHHLYRYSTMNSCGVYAQQYGTAISLAATPVMQRAGVNVVLQSPAAHH
ncbi:hypothetical protein Tco_0931662 [Tanacetum coccineum]